MKKAIAEIRETINRDTLAEQISLMYENHNNQRRGWLSEKQELRNFIFATDTRTTSVGKLPWKNSTTIPKLCQIRDNLHANYLSALFPSDDWLKWEGHSSDAVVKEKRHAIESYMKNKVRESNFRTMISDALYDYIDYGNAFGDVIFVNESTTDSETGEYIPGYIGPMAVRVSPLDHVFNPMAARYEDSYKITRYIKTIGELLEEVDSRPELGYNREVVEKSIENRKALGQFTPEDINKALGFAVDGFGSLTEYYQSGYVEVLEFEGTIHEANSSTLMKNVIITVIDRSYVARNEKMPSWLGKSGKTHVGWRKRPDNLYAMGPLDNLVGMQYRIDHLENLKADAMDLAVQPPLAIQGSVEEFVWGPGEEIYLGEGGSVQELGSQLNGVITANNEISVLEQKMEEMAGAPKQAMGIRTPGEKTAFEVQTLDQAASRIFQNKIQNFEINFVEPLLNKMLESARRNMDGSDLIRVMDDDIGVVEFLSITKEDITASGKLRPIGARHFAAQAMLVQNVMGLLSSPVGQDQAVIAHLSGKQIAKMMEELLGVERFAIFQENIRVLEQAETQQLISQATEDVMVADATPTEAPSSEFEE